MIDTPHSAVDGAGPSPAPSSTGLPSRRIAARALQAVLADHLALDVAIANTPGADGLDPRDRAFARLLAATTLRRLGQIDGALSAYLTTAPSPYVNCVLRTGAAQLLFLDTPPHAAISSAVDLLKKSGKTRKASGMVNAVLRRLADAGPKAIAAHPPKVNLPMWLQKSWSKAYGRAAVGKMAMALTQAPPLDLTVKSDPEGWAARLGGVVLPTGTVRLPKIGDITALEGFAEGEWWAQDVSAAVPVKTLGDIKGARVLDMCAAPGGKLLQLAAAGADVTGLDKSADRLARVQDNLDRTQLSATLIAVQAQQYQTEDLFDIVVLDAPCSATGIYRRNPDVIHNKSQNDVTALAKVQRTLLRAAAKRVKPGGTLLYCTCSLQAEEGELQIPHFFKNRSDFRLNPILTTKVLNVPEAISPEGYWRSLPYFMEDMGGMDGFFIARLVRGT